MLFKKGHIPWNKEMKGFKHSGSFKKGHPNKYGFQKGHPCYGTNESYRMGGEARKGENHCRWKGGRIKDKDGYIYLLNPNHPFCNKTKYIFEHRVIVEKYIGRYLTCKETVHHINEIKNDNRIENLMAFNSKSAHMRFHKNPDNVKPEEIIFDGRNYSGI